MGWRRRKKRIWRAALTRFFTAMQAFIDTSYFFARLATHDQWHNKAKRAASARNLAAVTSSLVVNETASLLEANEMFSAALTFLSGVRGSAEIRIIHVSRSVKRSPSTSIFV